MNLPFNLSKKNILYFLLFCFALLFVYAAISKFLDFEQFQSQLGQSPLLGSYAHIVVWLIPFSELFIAALLFYKSTQRIALLAFYSLMVMFSVYILIILNFTAFIPCSCGGVLDDLGWTEHLIFNAGFVLLAVWALFLQNSIQTIQTSCIKMVIHLVVLAFLATMAVTVLFLISEDTLKRNNSFLRRYPHHPVQKQGELDISFNSYYIAGITQDNIYLGNSTAPLHVLRINRALTDTSHIRIELKDKDNYNFTAVQLRVNEDRFYISDGTVPIVYQGDTRLWNANPIITEPIYFNRFEVMNDTTFIIRTRSAATNETVLGVLTNGDETQVELNHEMLEKQMDGVFDTDGHLMVNPKSNQVIYMYFYRNGFVVADNSLKVDYRGKTIDTVSKAQISIDTIHSRKENRLASAPLIVNLKAATFGEYMFVQSDRLGRFEPERMLKEAAILDVYNIKNKTYEFSFYIHHIKNQKLRSFAIKDSLLVALQGNLITTYKLKKETFIKTEEN